VLETCWKVLESVGNGNIYFWSWIFKHFFFQQKEPFSNIENIFPTGKKCLICLQMQFLPFVGSVGNVGRKNMP